MRNTKLLTLSVCVVLISVCGCSSNCKDRGECECITRYDCEETQYCHGGKCLENDQPQWIVPERVFGETCISHQECVDGVCLPIGPDNGGVCTKFCDNLLGCEKGWSCQTWTASEYFEADTHVCVQDTASRLCLPCAVDGHCNATGDLCIELEEGSVCSKDCSFDVCPQGYTCEAYERNGATYAQCIPMERTCECGAGKEEMGRACTNSNTHGVCAGWSYCRKSGNQYAWSECDAATPVEEVCNGVDDDCDGLIDNFDPGLSHKELEGDDFPICYSGGCIGRWQCREENEQYGWACDAGDPDKELCNGVDDNCNGIVDEPFVNSDGLYVDVENCGACGASCYEVLSKLRVDEDGTPLKESAACEVRENKSTCVPKLCEPGYYPYPHEAPTSCLKLESPACQVCGNDSDCRVYSDRCMTLSGDFGTHCLQSCDENSPYSGCSGRVGEQSCCPSGYTCQVMEGEKFCVPKGESCSCDATKLNMTRNCVATSGTDVCQGRQTCEKVAEGTYSWSECSAQTLTVEVCDGQDNNCDGNIDEDFRDAQGRYNAEEHCGKCNEDCPSHWKAPELHAEGACLLDGNDYACKFTGCKQENNILGKRCSEDQECGRGMKCDRQVYYCVSESGETSPVSCVSDNDCSSLSIAHRCIDKVCRVKVQYYDVNGISADGCECGHAIDSGIDYPDMFNRWPNENSAYIDRNCDGIDGEASSSIFVSSQSTQSLGTREHPYRTITEAINHFKQGEHSAILVSAGTYVEQVVMQSGIQLYGGYSADFSSRNIVMNPTLISAPPPANDAKPGTIYIPEVSQQTIVSGLNIQGYDVSESQAATGENGRNTYGIYIEKASSKLLIANNVILGGHAGDGGRGMSGESGHEGTNGADGKNSRECSNTTCYGETTAGGNGGVNSYCSEANGRVGATARDGGQLQDYQYDSRDGSGGENNSYQISYAEHAPYCKYDCLSGGYSNGSNGQNGQNGMSGQGGLGCTNGMGSVTNHVWHGESGQAGSAGRAAEGGGGGGAGGGAINYNDRTCTEGNLLGDIGGSGGGGGAGGCGGKAGNGGGSGGGAFGIWIAQTVSSPSIYGNQIRLGIAGNGGDGGDGGAGGKGGKGGIGGRQETPAWCSGAGGAGGGGGDGGSGGGGGAGCGGISIGISGVGIQLESFTQNNDFEYPENDKQSAAGHSGNGGNSPAGTSSYGANGVSGEATFVYSF